MSRDDRAYRSAPHRPRRRWVLPAILGVVTVLVLLAYFTPVLGVRTVRVEGNTTLDDQELLDAAQVRQGKPMLRVDAGGIRSRLEKVAKVDSARVTLSWPSAIRLDVTERVPVAYRLTGDGVRLIDSSGVVFDTLQQPPRDLPELRVRSADSTDAAKRSALRVLRALTPDVRSQTLVVTAKSPGDIRLKLRGDREVHWGSPTESARKAAILPPLLTQPGKVYDVISPALPTVA